MTHLDWLLTSSQPGTMLQHLLVVAAPRASVGPLGLVDESKLEVTMYGIIPDESSNATMTLVRSTIGAAAVSHEGADELVLFAGLSHEVWGVSAPVSENPEQIEEYQRYHREGRLSEHPDAVEQTLVYAACRDGRRWRGMRYLTGPKAGETFAVDFFVGREVQAEGFNSSTAPLVRRLVGLNF